jgi:4a-hydroxytetrahydrobiopterin dehydratase
MPRAVLPEAEAATLLADLPDWSFGDAGRTLECTVEFASFRAAQRFVDRLCDVAEGADHHPDLAWTYRRVTVRWWTHDAGGVTRVDARMAALTDHLAAELGGVRSSMGRGG